MKNIINYFYGIDLTDRIITNDNSNFYFEYENNFFCLSRLNPHETKRIIDIYNNYSFTKKFHSIIINKKGDFFSINNDDYYILMRINISDKQVGYIEIINYYKELFNTGMMFGTTGINWAVLWRRKVDFLEYYVEENQSINNDIKCLCNYFIGMSENAIDLMNYVINNYNIEFQYEQITLCHERIKKDYTLYDLYNPKNIILDHYSRDVSEYLKTLVFCDDYDNILDSIINEIMLSSIGYIMLLSRTMFPTFFYDALSDIDQDSFDDKVLIKMYDYVNRYEILISKLYLAVRKKTKLPRINWIVTIN